MTPLRRLRTVLVCPSLAAELNARDWSVLIRAARKEWLAGTLAARLADVPVPADVRVLLDEASLGAEDSHRRAGWEIDRMRRALGAVGIEPVLLKGSAYLAAGLSAAAGRNIGDLDILVPAARLGAVEAALLEAGWRGTKPSGGYDDLYYREWMHELPPLEHAERGGVVDLHHTILPRTARLTPRPERMLERARTLPDGSRVLAPADMILHAAAHLAHDGDFQLGLRNLWDVDRLLRHFAADEREFYAELEAEARVHQLSAPLARTLRLAHRVFGTPSPASLRGRADAVDLLARHKMFGRDRWGRPRAPLSRLLLYMRGHALRMPPLMLARHLFRKWRAGRREARS